MNKSDDASRKPPGDIILPQVVIERSGSTSQSQRSRPFWRRPIIFLPLVIFLLPIGGAVGMYFQPPGLKYFFEITGLAPGGGSDEPIAVAVKNDDPDETQIAQRTDTVMGLGRLQPEGDVRNLAPPFGAGDARVNTLHARIGERVEEGTIVASLDNESALRQATQTASADVEVKTAALAQARRNVLSQLGEAQAALATAQAAATNAAAEHERYATLFERGIVTRSALDTRKTALDQAEQEVQRARATLARLETDELDQQVDVAFAKRTLEAAVAGLRRAEEDLEKAYIRAPFDATVIAIHARPGERPGSEGVMDIGDTDQMIAKIEVFQSDISRVATGQQVSVTATAFEQPLAGEVTEIGLEVGRQTVIGDDPAANTDARVIEVTVRLDGPSSQQASRYVNLEILGAISVGGSATQ